MKLDDGTRPLHEVALHLTTEEAKELARLLADLLDDLTRVGLPTSHSYLGSNGSELGVFVYADETTLESEAADRLADEP